MGRRGNSLRRVLVLAVMACALTACGGSSGEKFASHLADQTADKISAELSRSPYAFDADSLILNVIPEALSQPGSEDQFAVLALAARGSKTEKEGARIEVRIHTDVAEHRGNGWGDSYHSAGDATKCYRFTVRYSDVDKDAISCPDKLTTVAPPTVTPHLPDDAVDVLKRVVSKTSPTTVAAEVRAAFTQKYITVDTAMAGGKIIAAVGVPEHRDCIVAVRDGDGVHIHQGFEGTWLAPGETGCTTELITNPPL